MFGWLLWRIQNGERGANLLEYGLLVSLIAVVCLGAVAVFGTNTSTSFSSAASLVANP